MVFFVWRRIGLSLKIICLFILFTLLVEASAIGIALLLQKPTTPTLHIFTWGENILLGIYFYLLYERQLVKTLVLGTMMLFGVFWIYKLIMHSQMLQLPPTSLRLIECVIMMLLCIYFYFELFLSSQTVNLMRYPHYWLVSGFLLYFAGTFFLNLVGDMAINSARLGFYGYDIHSVLNIFLNLIFTLTLWIGRKASISAQY
jgi:hypothetical protein